MTRQIVTILMMIAALVAVIVLKGRCGTAVEGMFKAIDQPALTDGGPATPTMGD
jgi:hypothetical protein